MLRSPLTLVRSYRLVLATAILIAVVYLLSQAYSGPRFVITFLSYFTIQSNLIAAIVLLWNAALPPAGAPTLWRELVRGGSVLYLSITGIIFSLLLSGYNDQVQGAMVWTNVMLHYIAPVAVFLDWLIDPPSHALTFRRALVWLVYPLFYLTYTMIRGAIIGWYPYPFLDPGVVGGYGMVAVFGVVVLAGVLALSALLVAVKQLSPPAVAIN